MELEDLNIGDKIASTVSDDMIVLVVVSRSKYGVLCFLADAPFRKMIFLDREDVDSKKFIKIEGLMGELFDFTYCSL